MVVVVRKTAQVAISLALAATACGGGRAVPASCGNVVGCGGSLVGDWAFEGSCVNTRALADLYMALLQTSCAPDVTSTSDVTQTNVPTTVSFRADGTYAGTFILTGSIGIRIPVGCLVGTCADADARVRAMVAPGGDVAAASCSSTVAACSCSIRRELVSNQTGTYTADGFSLLTQPNLGPTTAAEYCVAEPELHLVARAPVSEALDSPLIFASDVVLVRQ